MSTTHVRMTRVTALGALTVTLLYAIGLPVGSLASVHNSRSCSVTASGSC